jgi:DNA-binding MarR family transcriptional regulator
MPHTLPQDVIVRDTPERRPGYLVKRAQAAVHGALEKALSAHGLTVAQYAVLAMLAASPGMSNAELARQAFVTPQSMNEVLKQLETAGLVERHRNPANARVLDARLSASGKRTAEAVDEDVATMEEQMLHGLTATEQRTLIRALSAIVRNLGATP